jgi:hypothetical protein
VRLRELSSQSGCNNYGIFYRDRTTRLNENLFEIYREISGVGINPSCSSADWLICPTLARVRGAGHAPLRVPHGTALLIPTPEGNCRNSTGDNIRGKPLRKAPRSLPIAPAPSSAAVERSFQAAGQLDDIIFSGNLGYPFLRDAVKSIENSCQPAGDCAGGVCIAAQIHGF